MGRINKRISIIIDSIVNGYGRTRLLCLEFADFFLLECTLENIKSTYITDSLFNLINNLTYFHVLIPYANKPFDM